MGCTCSLAAQDVMVDTPPLRVMVDNGDQKFFRLNLTMADIKGHDLVIQVKAVSGLFQGIWFSRDVRFPSSTRKVWEQTKISRCTSETCSRTYPDCRNPEGGICTTCMEPNKDWTVAMPKKRLGGLANSDDASDLNDIGRSHSGCTFALRLQSADKNLQPGPYYLTVVSLPLKPGSYRKDKNEFSLEVKKFEAHRKNLQAGSVGDGLFFGSRLVDENKHETLIEAGAGDATNEQQALLARTTGDRGRDRDDDKQDGDAETDGDGYDDDDDDNLS